MILRRIAWILLVAAGLAGKPAWAFDPPATGVVVVHGKWGRPGDPFIGPFAAALRDAGFVVEQPEMPWSGARLYDRSFDQAMDEIQASVERLRAKGMTKIAVAGHSLGGAAVLRYASLGRPIDAVALIAPAPLLEGTVMRRLVADDVARAQAMLAAGRGEDRAWFLDVNSGNRSRSLNLTAVNYLSYNAPDSPGLLSRNAAHLGPAPILWIAPKFDPVTPGFDKLAWAKVPAATPKTRVDVNADHMQAPMAGRQAVVDWLKALK